MRERIPEGEGSVQRVENRVFWLSDSVKETYDQLDYPYELFSLRAFDGPEGQQNHIGEFVVYSGDITQEIIDETLGLVFETKSERVNA